MTAIHASAARGFAVAADAYERGRPAYPPDAVAAVVERLDLGTGRAVLDLAAGTGKLGRLLRRSGARVVAVEPVAEMRQLLELTDSADEIVDGTAEAIPLPNASMDAVVVGQAFHWFDGVRALSEIRRVLRPAGRVAVLWNVRDSSIPWVARLDELIDRLDDGHPRYRTHAWREAFDRTALFRPLERLEFAFVQRGNVETFVDRVASISYVAAADASARAKLLEDVRSLLTTDPATADRDVVEMPYRTDVFVAQRHDVTPSPALGVVLTVNISSPGGVPKHPVDRAWVDHRRLEGDGHNEPEPMHGTPDQAVSLYSMEAIERVRADGHEAFPGAYGENLTLSGLDWSVLRTGDRLDIGLDGLVVELTDYASPCQTIAQWFTGRRIARVSEKQHPEDARWYARVVSEGPVAAGDEVHREPAS